MMGFSKKSVEKFKKKSIGRKYRSYVGIPQSKQEQQSKKALLPWAVKKLDARLINSISSSKTTIVKIKNDNCEKNFRQM